ncbi:MAG TPA: hypothetical protein VFX48_02405 [Saprospiraceae bacterium]|nr:hypothetical protein [Saprospiraceae bacterium]
MEKRTHQIYISTLVTINVVVLIYLIYTGYSYYSTPVVERFFHEDHASLKPSGPFGHGYGIVGTLLILIGVFGYIARKKFRSLSSLGRLKHWLEFHIFLCTLGPMLVLFHTAFKFGGIVSVSFWSMVAVVASGVIGRFIYIQIPRTIEGRELSLVEAQALKVSIGGLLRDRYQLDAGTLEQLIESTADRSKYADQSTLKRWYLKGRDDRNTLRQARAVLQEFQLPGRDRRQVLRLIKNEIALNQKIDRLHTMQALFRYWHVAHLPFALIMLVIMVIHVIVTLSFGYRWIF